jgi:hypothetical protein
MKDREKSKRKRNIVPVELPDDLRDQLRAAADEIGEPVSTLMRLAIRAGLPEARRVLLVIFLHAQWGAVGLWAGFTFVPPIIICPPWEWFATGNPLTFILIAYAVGVWGLVSRAAKS